MGQHLQEFFGTDAKNVVALAMIQLIAVAALSWRMGRRGPWLVVPFVASVTFGLLWWIASGGSGSLDSLETIKMAKAAVSVGADDAAMLMVLVLAIAGLGGRFRLVEAERAHL